MGMFIWHILMIAVNSVLLVYIALRWIRLGSFRCALGFHDWENELYDSDEGMCIVCKRCPTRDFGLGVG